MLSGEKKPLDPNKDQQLAARTKAGVVTSGESFQKIRTSESNIGDSFDQKGQNKQTNIRKSAQVMNTAASGLDTLEYLTNDVSLDETINEDNIEDFFRGNELNLNIKNSKAKSEKIDVDALKDEFEIKYKDPDGRTILHRAALNHKPDALQQTFDKLVKLEEQQPEEFKLIIEELDNYGNTPLGLACINDVPDKKQDTRIEVVKILLIQKKANPNVQNPSTLWTPLHWAARYGAINVIQALMNSGAKEYLPDKRGFFPIDYAGFFKHHDAVDLLIGYTLKAVSHIKKQPQDQEIDVDLLLKKVQQSKLQSSSTISEADRIFQFNPIYHTSMLYWATIFKKIESTRIDQILLTCEAYPEGPVNMVNWRTPIHAAASVGNLEKLKRLIIECQKRYLETKINDPSSIGSIAQKTNYFPNFRTKFDSLLKSNNIKYQRLRTFYTQVFEKKLIEYQLIAQTKLKYDFQDRFLNTPLHVSAQNGWHECTETLLQEYKLSLDIRNLNGWMAKDLKQHDDVNKVFQVFYFKLDQQYNHLIIEKRRKTLSLLPQQPILDNESLNISGVSRISQSPSVASSAAAVADANQKRTEKDKWNKELIQYRELMPTVPPIVLKVNIKEAQVINNMIKRLVSLEFNVKMFPCLDQGFYYITLDLGQHVLEREAEQMKLKVMLVDMSAKMPFNMSQKIKFEPFRTKDVQTIMMGIINRIIDPDQFLRQGILQNIILMHDLYGIHEIRTKWEGSSKFFLNPIPLINQFFKEGLHYEFTELSSVKNYFGEKVAFQFAWMSFYTSWLLIPAGGGLILTIYQIAIKGVDTAWTGVYAILICIWVTIFFERWKRKSSEISFKWGVLKEDTDLQRVKRSQFHGDEFYSTTNHDVDKRLIKTRFWLNTLLPLPIFIILIGVCIACYFGTKYVKDYYAIQEKQQQDQQLQEGQAYVQSNSTKIIGILAGIVNGVVISIINFTYQKLAALLVKIENHKYEDTYEKSFVTKIFVFKFINTNLSLFYAAFGDRDFTQLYYLILGMVLQKIVQIHVLKSIKRISLFQFKKWMFFKKVKTMAVAQRNQHRNYISELDEEQREIIQEGLKKQKQTPIYSIINEELEPALQRLIFSPDSNIDQKMMYIDHIEQNQLLSEKSELDDINQISELFILFALSVLYSAACPIATFIVMLHNLLDIKLELRLIYSFTRRPMQKSATNIGTWYSVAQFIAIFAVITNSLLLYFTTPKLQQFLFEQFEFSSDVITLWIIVAIEHLIIAIKICCEILISDVTPKVQKAKACVENEWDAIQSEEAAKKVQANIEILYNRLKQKDKELKEIRLMIKQAGAKHQKQIADKDAQIKELKRQNDALSGKRNLKMQQEPDLKGVGVLKQIELDKKNKQSEGFFDFLSIDQSQWFGAERAREVQKRLYRNMMVRLMKQTFAAIEKEILSRRITRLFDSKRVVTINCAQCWSQLAVIECTDCQDHYCQKCADQIHYNKQFFQNHSMYPIKLDAIAINPKEKKQDVVAIYGSQKSLWKKFEYYNFPIQQGNDMQSQVQRHYLYLRQQYITLNYIESIDKIDLQALFVGQNYELLSESQATSMITKMKKANGDQILESLDKVFNDEETLLMNRVAFYLFRHKGDSLTFANFIMRLSILQEDTLQKRITLWLSLIDETGTEVIKREQFERTVMVEYLQDLSLRFTTRDIVAMIYQGEVKELTLNKILEIAMGNEEVKAFMACLVQYQP